YFNHKIERNLFSSYHRGDVFLFLEDGFVENHASPNVECPVGMATAAALFKLEPHRQREIEVNVPLIPIKKKQFSPLSFERSSTSGQDWSVALNEYSSLKVPDERYQFLYESAIRTMVLHSAEEVVAGPYTYKRFWFRDAVLILHAMLCIGLKKRVFETIKTFPSRQTAAGFFHSQKGEWDSNGQVLWLLKKFFEMTGDVPDQKWFPVVRKGARWLMKKRVVSGAESAHEGLLAAGFSAEHLGPNDYYYWDDFWGIAGLQAASWLMTQWGRPRLAEEFAKAAKDLEECVEKSLRKVAQRIGKNVLPASPYRRMDSGAIGSIVVGYPLQLWPADDERLVQTAEYLLKNCLVKGGFFHDMSHSGINPYLTLHLAQVLLRRGDLRFFDLMKNLANFASPTGQWPEAIHPATLGGCMGDGQHVWAAAEWVMMIRNCFVQEEQSSSRLILCAGIPPEWSSREGEMFFGPTLTCWGAIAVKIKVSLKKIQVSWDLVQSANANPPQIEVRLPGYDGVVAPAGEHCVELFSQI
ncbi:MAG: hypothetical protein NUV91_00260, partial [Candidatus Omnitrophica bacterium]|nr:hypothetical protein [Candidatus Omnitrophota bacterium]